MHAIGTEEQLGDMTAHTQHGQGCVDYMERKTVLLPCYLSLLKCHTFETLELITGACSDTDYY